MENNNLKSYLDAARLHAEQHEIIKVDEFKTVQEYILHLMHLSDYSKAALIAKNKVVLDFGCNGGYGASIMSKYASHVTGIDVSKAAIKSASSKYSKNNLAFETVDGVNLPFQDNFFDMVTAFQVIEHLPSYEFFFTEITRVLKQVCCYYYSKLNHKTESRS